ncbi:MAG: response regulator [Saprospiraceae bacterium]|nr:response regulator [Saprospiraceae bacterium]
MFCQQQVFRIQGQAAEWLLNEYLEVAELPNDELGLADLSDPAFSGGFLPYKEFEKKYLINTQGGLVLLDPNKVYWWRLRLQNELDQPIKDWVLYTGRSNFTEVYDVDGMGRARRTSVTGFLTPANKKDFTNGNRQAERVAFSLPMDSATTLYAKVKVINQKPPYIQVKLAKSDFYQSRQYVRNTRADWAFLGFLLSYILLNLLLYSSTLDRVFLWHALFQAGIFIYLMEFFNVMPDLLWLRDRPHLLQYVVYAALCLMDVACLQFIRYFMVMKKSKPEWDRRFRIFIWCRLAFALLMVSLYALTMNVRLTDNITSLFLVCQYLGIIVLLRWIFGKLDRRGFFLSGGMAFFVTGVVLNAIYVIKGVGLRFSFTQIGVIGEVALFTLGIGFRMSFLHKEKRKALTFKSLDEFKSKFYTNITHEFRTPLTVILGMAEQLGEARQQSVGSQKDKVELIRRNGEQLLRLINQLLDLSKAQSGKLALNLRQADVADYLRYLVGSFHSFAATKDIGLRLLSNIDRLDMDFDAEKLQDILSNLLSNAIKFTPPGGEITVTVGRTPANFLTIKVQDNGAGIPEEALPHIFDRFFTAKDTGNPAGGSGIGLALTKELVELMSGSISVESKVGVGTSFSVLLPISNEAPIGERPDLPKPLSETTANQVFIPVEQTYFRLGAEEDEKLLCLVIDDSADIVRYLQMLLEPEYIVAVAYDGKRGIEKPLELLPDVIISDVMMPEKDGLEVCDFLKNDERTSHIPIILLTAKATVADRIEGLRRGADAYLQKPFNREELFIQLKKSVELRRRLSIYFSKMPSLSNAEPAPELDIQIEDAFLQKARAAVEKTLPMRTSTSIGCAGC